MNNARRTAGSADCSSSRSHFLDHWNRALLLGTGSVVALTLFGCGGGSDAGANNPAISSASASTTVGQNTHSDAALSEAEIVASTPGGSPFIQRLSVHVDDPTLLSSVEFVIEPKPGSASKAVDVTYSGAALTARGYFSGGRYFAAAQLTLPVFGLYAGYTNQVTLQLHFQDGSNQALRTSITTSDYVDPTGIYQRPTILKQRAPGSSLGFDFFFMKSGLESPVVVDTDGEIRWAVPTTFSATSTGLQGDEFVIGDTFLPIVHRLSLDGTFGESPLDSPTTPITDFNHNIDRGKTGLLAEVDTKTNVESTVAEITGQGGLLDLWDMAAIISSYMLAHGDDPTAFVRPGVDWFHSNAATYDPTDDSVIISSRENFLIKLDYQTHQIIWILGDPTKYWYTFPSLRAKALTLAPGGLYPIGQHAISITPNGHLLLFNDGDGSLNQPAGAPAGETRTFSAVSAYSIDTEAMTAQNLWNFEYGQTIYSPVCSSAYVSPEGSLLVDYATADNITAARLVGLDSNHNVAFDFQYPTSGCNTSWNAVPIALDSLILD